MLHTQYDSVRDPTPNPPFDAREAMILLLTANNPQLSELLNFIGPFLDGQNLDTRKTITQEAFCREYKQWGSLIDPIIHTAISLAYHDSDFTWPCDKELQCTNPSFVSMVSKALKLVIDAHKDACPQDLLETSRSCFFSLYA